MFRKLFDRHRSGVCADLRRAHRGIRAGERRQAGRRESQEEPRKPARTPRRRARTPRRPVRTQARPRRTLAKRPGRPPRKPRRRPVRSPRMRRRKRLKGRRKRPRSVRARLPPSTDERDVQRRHGADREDEDYCMRRPWRREVDRSLQVSRCEGASGRAFTSGSRATAEPTHITDDCSGGAQMPVTDSIWPVAPNTNTFVPLNRSSPSVPRPTQSTSSRPLTMTDIAAPLQPEARHEPPAGRDMVDKVGQPIDQREAIPEANLPV